MADDPKAGTPDEEQEGGTATEAAGTPAPDLEGGTEGELTPDEKAELERLRAAHQQSLGEKDAFQKRIKELEERAATPPTPDPGLQSQINAERERIAALQRAADQGDPVAAEFIEFKQQTIRELQFQKIADANEREEVRALMAKYPGRFADVDVARYTLRGLKAEYEQKQAATQPKPEPKPAPKKPTVATGARSVETEGTGGTKPMPFSQYLAQVNRGGAQAEQLKADKDAGRLLIDYAK